MVTVITKTIGAGGGYDYATFTAAEADVENVATTAFGSTDLVANDGAIVFEAVAGTYSGAVTFSSTLTTDATRNVTYKPASGSEHGGDPNSGVILTGGVHTINDAYTAINGLTAKTNTGQPWTVLGNGVSIDSCIGVAESGASKVFLVGGCDGASLRNCVAIGSPYISIDLFVGSNRSVSVYNCTIADDPSGPGGISYAFRIGNDTVVDVTNCISLRQVANEWTIGTGCTVTGSNNFGRATGANGFPAALQGTPYPITATTNVDPGPGDWAIYDAATGALIDDPDNDVLAGGIGPDANPLVPTTDILGNTRSGATTDPGAFEISTLAPPEPALITIMRQIYQQDASFSVGASSAGVEKITHQLGPASADYFTINSTTSATVSVPRTAHALRVICVVASKACDVTLDLDASNSVFLGSIGGVASVQTDLTYFWSFGQVVSDGTYPRVRIVNDGFAGDQLVYLWWHLA